MTPRQGHAVRREVVELAKFGTRRLASDEVAALLGLMKLYFDARELRLRRQNAAPAAALPEGGRA